MRPIPGSRSLAPAALVGALATAFALPAGAATAGADDWQVNATLYGWFPSITGSVTFKNAPTGPLAAAARAQIASQVGDISVSPDDILDALNSVFMGTLEVRKGPWGAFTDVIYMDVGADKNKDMRTLFANAPARTANVDFGLSATIWTLAGEYRFYDSPLVSANALLGARYASIDNSLAITVASPLPGQLPTARLDANPSVWDGIIGVKGEFKPAGNWFIPYYLDVGTGESKLTWQALLGAGYRFHWGDIVLAYRYMDYQIDNSSEADLDLAFGGVALGVTFRF